MIPRIGRGKIEYSINGYGKKVGRHLKNRIYISYQNKFQIGQKVKCKNLNENITIIPLENLKKKA